MRRVFLGVDCGTQSTKVVLRDAATGGVVAVGRAPHELIERGDGTREQDPTWWIDALRIAVRDAMRGERFDVGGIGVSGQQHGLVCLDRSDRPARAAKLWNDTTTARECAELMRKLGGDVRARRYSDAVLAAIDATRDWTRTLPPIARSLSVVGTLRKEAAEPLGLDAGV